MVIDYSEYLGVCFIAQKKEYLKRYITDDKEIGLRFIFDRL